MNKVSILAGILAMILLASCGAKPTNQETSQSTKNLPANTEIEAGSVALDNETVANEEEVMEDTMMNESKGASSTETVMEEETMENEVMMEKEDTMMQDDTMMEEKAMEAEMEKEPTSLAGVYAEYDSSLVGQNDTTVIAFFASWCPSCRAADSTIGAEEIPEGLTILKADFDAETDLRKKYGIVAQHTFVQVDADGNEVKKWLGGTSVEDVLERVR